MGRQAKPRSGRWIHVLTLLAIPLIAGSAFLYGFLVHKTRSPPYGTVQAFFNDLRLSPTARRFAARSREDGPLEGRWSRTGADGDLAFEVPGADALRSLGYLAAYEPAGDRSGVTLHEPGAEPGLNLVVWGQAQEAVLLDMDGRELHRWSHDFEQIFPDHPAPPPNPAFRQLWRRAHLFENGDLLAVYQYAGLVLLDAGSRVRWARPERFHHDVDVDAEGRIHAIVEELVVLPRIREHEIVREDTLVTLTPDGEIEGRVSVLEAFERSPFASHLRRIPATENILHTNAITILDGSHADRMPAFAAGRALVSLRELDTVAVVDLEAGSVVWALTGQWVGQHEPSLLPSGNLLVFDNRGRGGRSRIVEIDPRTQERVWTYPGATGEDFYTRLYGTCQRLPGGNTLITDSMSGRAFEVTPDGRRVWEFHNPGRAGSGDELVAVLLDVVRLPPDFPIDWARGGDHSRASRSSSTSRSRPDSQTNSKPDS